MMSLFKTLEHALWKANRKRDKRLAKARADRHKKLGASLERDRIRREVFARDKGKCRACGEPVWLMSSDDFKVMHAHHVIYASAGGSDEASNRVALCMVCHHKEHVHIIAIEGDPRETLTITHRDAITLDVLYTKDSPCPS